MCYVFDCVTCLYASFFQKCLWKIPRETHREIVALLSDCMPIQIALYSRMFKFVKTAFNGPSKVTATVMRMAQTNPRSVFTRNINLAM